MYFSKGKPKICTPTAPKPMNFEAPKNGIGHLDLYLTLSAKFGSDWFERTVDAKTPFLVDLGLLLFFIFSPYFFDRATDRIAEPISIIGSSNDVFSCEEKPFGNHVDM
jgi:hypothetical protein